MRLISPDTLRALMAQKRVSYADLAGAADVSKGFVSHLLSNPPRKKTCKPATADKIARRLDVPLELLFVPSISNAEGSDVKQQRRAA